MNSLPTELWQLILAEVEDRTLSETIPCVCKLFQKFCGENGNVWMQKSSEKANRYSIEGVNKKTDQQTWKQFYFYDPLCLFPLWGISIGKSTREDIIKITKENGDLVVADEYGPSIYINELDFWLDSDTDVFTDLDVILQTSRIPEKWQKLGIHQKMTAEYAMKLFNECSQNC